MWTENSAIRAKIQAKCILVPDMIILVLILRMQLFLTRIVLFSLFQDEKGTVQGPS